MAGLKIISTAVLIFCFSPGFSQNIKDRTLNSAKNKTNQRIDRKIDEGIDKSLNSIFNKKKAQQEENASASSEPETSTDTAPTANPFFTQGSQEIESTYDFPFNMTMEMTSTRKKKSNTMEFEMLVNEEKEIIGMEFITIDGKPQDPPMKMIMDHKNQLMITLLEQDGNKSGLVMNYNPEAISSVTDKDDASEKINFSKTGKTKELLGYTCHQYTFEDDKNSGDVWVAEDLEINMTKVFSSFSQGNKDKNNVFGDVNELPQGAALEMNSISKDGNETAKMLVTEIDPNGNKQISTESYQIMNMGNMGIMKN